MSAAIEDDIVGMNRGALQIPAWAPSDKEGAQVEPPGGMKGKDGAVTSTNCITSIFFFSLCV